MKRFAYVCADPGIPVPGRKGSSGHVASVCRELGRAGLTGEVYAARTGGDRLGDIPVIPIAIPEAVNGESPGEREMRFFLGGGAAPPADSGPYDFIYERYSLWHVRGLARARELGIPFVLEINSPLPDEAKRFRNLKHERLATELAGVLCREADGAVCVSASVAEWVRSLRGRSDGIWVVPNGVDTKLFSPSLERPAPLPRPGVPLIAFCGSFRPWHALDDLLEAFHMLLKGPVPGAHLVCVGDGPTRVDFERRARDLGIGDRVHVTGILPQAEVPGWLAGADVAVAPYGPSDDFYFSPLKVFEFLALGLPVVAADIGQIAEIVPDGERGVLYPPGDVAALARALGSILLGQDRAQRLGESGRAWAVAEASWSGRVGEILGRIEELRS